MSLKEKSFNVSSDEMNIGRTFSSYFLKQPYGHLIFLNVVGLISLWDCPLTRLLHLKRNGRVPSMRSSHLPFQMH